MEAHSCVTSSASSAPAPPSLKKPHLFLFQNESDVPMWAGPPKSSYNFDVASSEEFPSLFSQSSDSLISSSPKPSGKININGRQNSVKAACKDTQAAAPTGAFEDAEEFCSDLDSCAKHISSQVYEHGLHQVCDINEMCISGTAESDLLPSGEISASTSTSSSDAKSSDIKTVGLLSNNNQNSQDLFNIGDTGTTSRTAEQTCGVNSVDTKDSNLPAMDESSSGKTSDSSERLSRNKRKNISGWKLDGPLVVHVDNVPKKCGGELQDHVNTFGRVIESEKKSRKGVNAWRFRFERSDICSFVVDCLHGAQLFEGCSTSIQCYLLEQDTDVTEDGTPL